MEITATVESVSIAKTNSTKIRNGLPWLILFCASLFPFYTFIQMNLLNVLNQELTQAFAINHEKLGTLSAIYIYADALWLIPVGLLLDRYPLRLLLIIGASLVTFGAALFAISNNMTVASMARAIAGSGHAFALLGCFRLSSLWFPTHRQAFVIGSVITIAILGGVVSQTPLRILVENTSLHFTLWANAAVGLLLCGILSVSLPHNPNHATQNIQHVDFLNRLIDSTKNGQNWLCAFYTCFLSLPLMILGALWGGTYLATSNHLSPLQASWVTSMIFIGTIIGSPVVGYISDRLAKRKAPMVMGGLVSLLTIIAILYLPHLSLTKLIILFFALGFFSSTQIISYPTIAESNPATIRGTAMGFSNTLMMVGAASVQLIFSGLWKTNIPSHFLGQYNFAMNLLPLTFLLSVIFAVFIKETNCKQAD